MAWSWPTKVRPRYGLKDRNDGKNKGTTLILMHEKWVDSIWKTWPNGLSLKDSLEATLGH
jgi:hypothetical protein